MPGMNLKKISQISNQLDRAFERKRNNQFQHMLITLDNPTVIELYSQLYYKHDLLKKQFKDFKQENIKLKKLYNQIQQEQRLKIQPSHLQALKYQRIIQQINSNHYQAAIKKAKQITTIQKSDNTIRLIQNINYFNKMIKRLKQYKNIDYLQTLTYNQNNDQRLIQQFLTNQIKSKSEYISKAIQSVISPIFLASQYSSLQNNITSPKVKQSLMKVYRQFQRKQLVISFLKNQMHLILQNLKKYKQLPQLDLKQQKNSKKYKQINNLGYQDIVSNYFDFYEIIRANVKVPSQSKSIFSLFSGNSQKQDQSNKKHNVINIGKNKNQNQCFNCKIYQRNLRLIYKSIQENHLINSIHNKQQNLLKDLQQALNRLLSLINITTRQLFQFLNNYFPSNEIIRRFKNPNQSKDNLVYFALNELKRQLPLITKQNIQLKNDLSSKKIEQCTNHLMNIFDQTKLKQFISTQIKHFNNYQVLKNQTWLYIDLFQCLNKNDCMRFIVYLHNAIKIMIDIIKSLSSSHNQKNNLQNQQNNLEYEKKRIIQQFQYKLQKKEDQYLQLKSDNQVLKLTQTQFNRVLSQLQKLYPTIHFSTGKDIIHQYNSLKQMTIISQQFMSRYNAIINTIQEQLQITKLGEKKQIQICKQIKEKIQLLKQNVNTIQSRSQEITKLKEQNDKLKQSKHILTKQNLQLNQKIQDIENKLFSENSIKLTFEKLNKQNTQLKQINSKTQEQNVRYKKQNIQISSKVESLSTQVSQGLKQKQSLKQQINRIILLNAQINKKYQTFELYLKQIQDKSIEDKSTIQESNKAYYKQLIDQQFKVKKLQEQNKKIKKQIYQQKLKVASLQKQIKQQKIKSQELEIIKKKLKQLEPQLQYQKRQNQQLQTQKSNIINLQRELQDYKKKNINQIEVLNLKISQLTNQVGSLKIQNNTLNNKIIQLNQQITNQKNEITNLNKKNKLLEAQIQKLTNQLSSSNKTNEILKTQLQNNRTISKNNQFTINALENNKIELEKQLKILNQKIPILQAVINNKETLRSQILLRGTQIIQETKHQNFLIQNIQLLSSKKVQKANLVYRMDSLNKLNPHAYFDNKKNLILIIKTETDKIIGGFVQQPFRNQKTIELNLPSANFLYSLNQFEIYPIKKSITKGSMYDQSYLIIGNSEIRIDLAKRILSSNFGVKSSHYECKQKKIQTFIGQTKINREVPIKCYEIYQIKFKDENNIEEQKKNIAKIQNMNLSVNGVKQKMKNNHPNKQKSVEKINELSKDISQKLQKQIEEMKKQLNQKQNQIQQLKKQSKIKEDQLKKYQNQMQLITKQLNKKIKQLEQKIITNDQLNSQLKLKNIQLQLQRETNLQLLNKTIEQRNILISQLQKQINNFKIKEKANQQKTFTTVNFQEKYNQASKQLQNINKRYQLLLKDSTVQHEQLEKLKISFENQIKKSRQLNQQSKELKSKIQQQNEKIFDLQRQLQQLLTNNRQKQATCQSLRKKFTILQTGDQRMQKFFVGDILDDQFERKRWLINTIQNKRGYKFRRTKLLYRYDKYNKINFHTYFDNHPNIILLVKTESGKLLGGYSKEEFRENFHSKDYGIIFSLTQMEYFERNRRNQSYKANTYDQFYIIFGNSQLRIKTLEDKVFSNFAILHNFYETKGKTVDFLLGKGEKNREDKIVTYEIYEIMFGDEKKEVIKNNSITRQ